MEGEGESSKGEAEIKTTSSQGKRPTSRSGGSGGTGLSNGLPQGKKKERKVKDEREGKPDTQRQLLKISICSIQLEKLIPAHRFKKNLPWVNVLYGDQGNWTAPYQESDVGDSAEFLGLGWEFILQRDTRHRDDLVVIVNSEDLIVGRYILGKADWVNVPFTESGFFKVSGDVINGLGYAGKIKIIFKKVIAPPPKAPRFIEHITSADTLNTNLPHTARAYIRIISIACADLRQVNLIEANSPHILLTCGDKWRKTTDVSVGSGLSAKWNRLPWKLIMGKFDPLVVNVFSTDTLVGRIAFTLDEVFDLPVNKQGFIEIIRPLSDGVRVSGRVRLVMLVRPMEPEDTLETYAPIGTAALQAEARLGEGGDITDFDAPTRVDPEGFVQPIRYPQYGRSTDGPDPLFAPKPSSWVIPGQAPGCPFIMVIKEIGVFDARQLQPGRLNSLSVNAVCGKWGCSTSEIPNSGGNALWIDIQSKWRFTVEQTCTLKLNLWSHSQWLGSLAISPQELLDTPTDPDGSMEILSKFTDDKGRSCGRVKVSGAYEWWREHAVVVEKTIPPVTYRPPGSKKINVDLDGEGVPQYELPVLAMVVAISAMDLKPVHGLVPNSPKAKVVCDRKMAQTTTVRFAGKQARWVDLNWPVPVNEGCIVNVYIYSGDTCIGWLEVEAHNLVRVPLDPYGLTVVNQPIFDVYGHATGRVSMQMQLHNVMVEDYTKLATKVEKSKYDLSPDKPKDINLRAPYVPPPELALFTQPFFSLEETQQKNAGIMLVVDILSLDVTDSKPMHLLEKNSLLVSAACGKFAASTTMIKHVGKDAFWDGLNWHFLMNDELSLQFVVGSGPKVVGILNILPPTFIAGRADQGGVKRVTLPIYDSERRLAGKLKITYTLGVIREGYINRPEMDNRFVEDIGLPFQAKIGRVVATGLARVHTFGPNQPKFRAQADDWSRVSNVYVARHEGGDGDGVEDCDAVWPSIGWGIPLYNDETPLHLSVVSGKELIGTAFIMPLELLDIPRSRDGVTEVVLTLVNLKGKATGRLQVFLRCLSGADGGGTGFDGDDEALQEAMAKLQAQGGEVEQSLSLPQLAAGSPGAAGARKQQAQGQQYVDPASIFAPQQDFRALLAPPKAELDPDAFDPTRIPSFFTITVTGVACLNLRSVHVITANSPYAVLHHGEDSYHSETRKGFGKTATWDGLTWYFAVQDPRTAVHLEILSGDVSIGVCEWAASDLYIHAKGRSGVIKKFDEMKFKARFDGKIKVSFVINGPKPPTPRPPEPEPEPVPAPVPEPVPVVIAAAGAGAAAGAAAEAREEREGAGLGLGSIEASSSLQSAAEEEQEQMQHLQQQQQQGGLARHYEQRPADEDEDEQDEVMTFTEDASLAGTGQGTGAGAGRAKPKPRPPPGPPPDMANLLDEHFLELDSVAGDEGDD